MDYLGPIPAAMLLVAPPFVACAWFLQRNPIVLFAGNPDGSPARGWIPALAMIGFVLFLSTAYFSAANTLGVIRPALRLAVPTATPTQAMSLNVVIRRCAHLGEYGLLLLLAVNGPLRGRRSRALLLCLVVALMDEGHQALEPERTGMLADVVLDMIGALVANIADLCVAAVQPSPRLRDALPQGQQGDIP